MAQEEETQRLSNSTSGGGYGGSVGGSVNIGNFGKSSKKQKHKKVPQRGLGVTQLEKIRLEEQKKKDGSIILASPPSSVSPTSPSNLSVSTENFQSGSSSIPKVSDLSSSDTKVGIQSTDNSITSFVPLANSVVWQPCNSIGHGNLPKVWSSNVFDHEKGSCGFDPCLAFRSGLDYFYDSNFNCNLPGLMQRAQQYQQQPSFHSMGNVSSSANSSSSLANFHMEPPSNQSYNGNYSSFWPEEDKMVGIKRSYPFYLDNPTGPSLSYKLPTTVHPICRSDEPTSSFATINHNSKNSNFRQGSSSSSNSVLEPEPRRSITKNGDFLTLAPPTNMASPSSKFKGPSAFAAFNSFQTFDFDSLPYQGMEYPSWQTGSRAPDQRYYSFLPPSMVQIDKAAKSYNNDSNNGEVEENIDLDLKL